MGVCQAGGPQTTTPSFPAPACADERDRLTPDDGPPLLGAYIPQCDNYGHYQPQQCHGSSGHCWCVDVHTGGELGGTRSGPTDPPPNCNQYQVEASEAEGESLFTDITRWDINTDLIPECHGEGYTPNCKRVWTVQNVLDNLQPGGPPVQLMPYVDLYPVYLTLRTPPTQNANSKSYSFTITSTYNGADGGEAIITFGNTGSVYGSVNPDSGDYHYLLRSCGNNCTILAERDANHFNNYSD